MKKRQRKFCFRRYIKNGKAVLLLGTAAMLLSGCGSGKEETVKSIKIGVTLYDQYDTFLMEMMQAFKEYMLKKESETDVTISVEILDASGSQTTQNEQVRTLVEKGCDVICVNLVDRTEPTTITDMAEKNNIPIIFSTGNWWQRIWNGGRSCIMSVRMRLIPAALKGRLQQMHF